MPASTLLLAGPVGLDLMETRHPLPGGAGVMAALAAGIWVPTQLWARVGDDFAPALRAQLADHHLDLQGLIGQGASSTWTVTAGDAHTPTGALPEEQPCDPVGVSCCAAVGLAPGEDERALDCFQTLPDGERRTVVYAASADACTAGRDHLMACAQRCDLLMAPLAAVCGQDDPLAVSADLVAAGATAVALSAGPLGGLLRYKNRLSTWSAEPRVAKDDRHADAVLAGCVAAHLCAHGSLDLRTLRRGLTVGSAVAAASIGDHSCRRLLTLDRSAAQGLFLRLRRNSKS